jgi:cardiolipin synthase
MTLLAMAPAATPEKTRVPTAVAPAPPASRGAFRRSRGMDRLRGHRVARRWRYKLAPDPLKRKPKGVLPFWSRLRRLFWSWWPWTLALLWNLVHDKWGWAIGMGLMALACYLIAPVEAAPQYGLDHEFAIDDEEFLPTMAGATGEAFLPGNALSILNNGDAFYPAMLKAIEEAEVSITIEAYIYWAGEVGIQFARALAAKAKAGVRVKILLDAVGSSTIGEDVLKILEAGACQLAWYNPLAWRRLNRYNHRTHRKSLIVDGRVAFTGGAGIADHWRGNARHPGEWRDLQIRIDGPAVTPLQTGFAQNWLQTTGELISGPLYYPLSEPAGSLALQSIMSSPEIGASTVRIMYYLSIICARRSILIANPYFVPDAAARDALIEAKRRGVHVRIMVAARYNDNWLAHHNSVRVYGRLLEAGIEILEYNHTMLHLKTMVVDGKWFTIGTTNFDNRSFAHNEENNTCGYDADVAGQLHRMFEDDVKGCDRLDLQTWKRRGLWIRAQEVVAAFFEEQI